MCVLFIFSSVCLFHHFVSLLHLFVYIFCLFVLFVCLIVSSVCFLCFWLVHLFVVVFVVFCFRFGHIPYSLCLFPWALFTIVVNSFVRYFISLSTFSSICLFCCRVLQHLQFLVYQFAIQFQERVYADALTNYTPFSFSKNKIKGLTTFHTENHRQVNWTNYFI